MSITEAIILGAVAFGLIVSLTLIWLHSRALQMDQRMLDESREQRRMHEEWLSRRREVDECS